LALPARPDLGGSERVAGCRGGYVHVLGLPGFGGEHRLIGGKGRRVGVELG
jgi:hypothetical protein